MKCDELKVQKIGDLCFDFKMGKNISPDYYRKSEADEAIAELKEKNYRLKKVNELCRELLRVAMFYSRDLTRIKNSQLWKDVITNKLKEKEP